MAIWPAGAVLPRAHAQTPRWSLVSGRARPITKRSALQCGHLAMVHAYVRGWAGWACQAALAVRSYRLVTCAVARLYNAPEAGNRAGRRMAKCGCGFEIEIIASRPRLPPSLRGPRPRLQVELHCLLLCISAAAVVIQLAEHDLIHIAG